MGEGDRQVYSILIPCKDLIVLPWLPVVIDHASHGEVAKRAGVDPSVEVRVDVNHSHHARVVLIVQVARDIGLLLVHTGIRNRCFH